MKLATYQDGSRDGQLVVVSRDLSQAHYTSQIANRMQQVLDDWNYLAPQLQDLSDALNAGRARHAFPFDARQCMAPLPRAAQWVEASGFPSHLELLAQAQGLPWPNTAGGEPVLAQASACDLLGACDPIVGASEDDEIDFGASVAVISADAPMGSAPDRALEAVRLVMLCNAVALRRWLPAAAALQGGSVRGRPCAAFSPVAVTPDELGALWSRGRLHAPLHVSWNARKVGRCEAGTDMQFHFGRLLSELARTRPLHAGSIVSCGPVSNRGSGKKGAAELPQGFCSIAEKRAVETLQAGQASTPYLRYGDTVRIEMKMPDGGSIFGAIEQEVVRAGERVSPAPVAEQTP